MRISGPVAVAFGMSLLSASAVHSEQRQTGGLVLRVGVGSARALAAVASQSDPRLGVVGSGQAGVALRRVAIVVDATIQPFRVRNPKRAESLAVLYVLPSVQVEGGGGFLRAGIGVARFWYSGSDVFVPSDTSLGLGASLGYGFRRPFAVEAIGRWSASSDGELTHRLLGIQVTYSWHRK